MFIEVQQLKHHIKLHRRNSVSLITLKLLLSSRSEVPLQFTVAKRVIQPRRSVVHFHRCCLQHREIHIMVIHILSPLLAQAELYHRPNRVFKARFAELVFVIVGACAVS